jgi:uncharacterized protein (DUF1800 family)
LLHEMRILGQPPFRAPAPTGWPDREGDWLDPAGVTGRVGSAQRLAGLAPQDMDASAMLANAAVFAPGAPTLDVVMDEPNPRRAIALVLASPEFQRR